MPTLKEISEKSGYSMATISRVLNGDPSMRVKDATRKAILDAAEDLQYQPGRYFRANGMQDMTWHIVHNFPKKEELIDPYYLAVRHGVENGLSRLGVYCKYSYSDVQEQINWKQDLALMVGFTSYSQVEKFAPDFHKTVFIDSIMPGFDSVTTKLKDSVGLVFEHLYSLGHRDILFIGARDEMEQMDQRERAYHQISSLYKIFHKNKILNSGQFSVEAGYKCLKQYLSKRRKLPTAIIAASDSLAIGALHALHEKNIEIPNDISITGINGIPMSEFTQPGLTTVKLPAEAMGEYAVYMLQEKLLAKRVHPIEVLFSPHLLVRLCSAKVIGASLI
ncbi:MAG: LacI family DNA-binding transcriptional regulator [Spirochaetota bacterium]